MYIVCSNAHRLRKVVPRDAILTRMRTLDDIIPPSRRRDIEPPGTSPPNIQLPKREPRFPVATMLIVALVSAAALGALFYFSSAKVDVTPNTVSVAVKSSFTASQS